MARFIDPRTDFGFKKLFGYWHESGREVLKQFLFDILDLPHPISELSYMPLEQLPASPLERRSIYDIYCVDTTGQRFIVEMQRGWQANIKERALYYATFPIIHQAQRGRDWDYEIMPIYFVGVLDFRMDDGSSERTVKKEQPYLHKIKLMNIETNEVFYDKLTFVYIELPNLQKSLEQLEGAADKWAYLIKHLVDLQEVPEQFDSNEFRAAFDIASEAALTPLERLEYETSLKRARDVYARIAGASQKAHKEGLKAGLKAGLKEGLKEGREEGREEGHKEGRKEGREEGEQAKAIEIARSMLAGGMRDDLILNLTGLGQDVLDRLKSTRA